MTLLFQRTLFHTLIALRMIRHSMYACILLYQVRTDRSFLRKSLQIVIHRYCVLPLMQQNENTVHAIAWSNYLYFHNKNILREYNVIIPEHFLGEKIV
jgi:hypothetical protein